MKKKIIFAMLITAMAVSLTACGDTVTDDSNAVASETTVSSEESETMSEKKIAATEISESETTTGETTSSEAETSESETDKEEENNEQQENNEPADNNNDNNNENNNNNNENNSNQNDNNNSNNNEQPAETQAPANTGSFDENDLIFCYNGQNIYLDEHINDVKAKIGEPNDTIVAPSCAYDGDDKTFVYDGFSVNTYPDGENDYVVSITITESGIKTSKGAEVGMSINDVIAIYGEGYSNSGSNYQYQIGDKYMYFYVEGDTVQEIGIMYENI